MKFGDTLLSFLPGIFFRGAKSIVIQISFVTIIFLLFLGSNFGGGSL